MSTSQRSGSGAMIRISGPKKDKNVPMAKLALVRQINKLYIQKPKNHQGPPRTVVGTGGFKLNHKKK